MGLELDPAIDVEGEAGGCGQGCEQEIQLPGRVAFEQPVRLEGVRHGEDEYEHQAGTEVRGLLPRQRLEFVAESLRGLAHDGVREVRVGAHRARDQMPGFRGQQEHEGAGDCYRCRAADRLDIHAAPLPD